MLCDSSAWSDYYYYYQYYYYQYYYYYYDLCHFSSKCSPIAKLTSRPTWASRWPPEAGCRPPWSTNHRKLINYHSGPRAALKSVAGRTSLLCCGPDDGPRAAPWIFFFSLFFVLTLKVDVIEVINYRPRATLKSVAGRTFIMCCGPDGGPRAAPWIFFIFFCFNV